MSQNDSSREAACTLTEEQERKRSKDVRSRLISHYVGYEETEGGLAIWFDGTDESLPAVAQFTELRGGCHGA